MTKYTLTYETLQEIHKLTGMVCGWHMSLPTVMIKQAKKVHEEMLSLKLATPDESNTDFAAKSPALANKKV